MSAKETHIAPEPQFTPEEIGKNVLVTGGAGYLGSAIVERLLKVGCKVRSFDLMDHDNGAEETVVGDISNYADVRKAMEGIDTVFHTVALISLVRIYKPSLRKKVFDVNVKGSKNVVRAAADAKVHSVVHTSTFNVVMDRVLIDKDESVPYATKTYDLYCLSKIEAEKAVLSADNPAGLRTVAIRPGGIWGSDTRSIMISSLLDTVAQGKFTALIGDGKSLMDNTHIENVIDSQLLAAKGLREQPEVVGGQAYFINDDEQVNPLEWFRPIVEGVGHKFPTMKVPGSLMKVITLGMEVAHMLGGPEPVVTHRSIRNLTESSSFRIDKARRELGYEPRYQRANAFPLLMPHAKKYVEERTAGS